MIPTLGAWILNLKAYPTLKNHLLGLLVMVSFHESSKR